MKLQLIKDTLREYLSTPPELFKIVSSTYLVDDDQQVEDDRVLSANIQGKERAQQMLGIEVKDAFRYLTAGENVVEKPQSVSPTETRIYYNDGYDDYYLVLQIVSQKPSLGDQERRIADFLRYPCSWSEHEASRRGHVLNRLYNTALQELGFFTTLNEAEDTMLVYLVYDANFQEEAEPFSEYPAETEKQFMDDLTQEYLDEFKRDSYVSNRAYIDRIKKFFNTQISLEHEDE